MEIEEKGVRLRLTVVDTPGFGDALNCEDSWRAIEKYIDEQFNQFFRDESGLNRKNIVDNRVHCCLYFIPPWGHGLRPLDIEFMKRLHKKVGLIYVQHSSSFRKTKLIRLKIGGICPTAKAMCAVLIISIF